MEACTKTAECLFGQTCLPLAGSLPVLSSNETAIVAAPHFCMCTNDLYGYAENCADTTW